MATENLTRRYNNNDQVPLADIDAPFSYRPRGTDLPKLRMSRHGHACGKFTKKDGTTVSRAYINFYFL